MMITLENNRTRITIDPDHGAIIRRATIDGVAVLRSSPPGNNDPLLSGYYPCVPYFGRIATGILYKDELHTLAPTHIIASPEIALHGEGWISRWQVETRGVDFVTCTVHAKTAHGLFPAHWAASQTVHLHDSGFSIRLGVTNQDDAPAPISLALHPFIVCTKHTQIDLAYDEIIAPPGLRLAMPPRGLFQHSAPLPNQMLDHSFTGWNGVARLTNPSLTLTASTSNLHIYHPAGADFVCLEPISHLPGATDGMTPGEATMLAPGQWREIEMRVVKET